MRFFYTLIVLIGLQYAAAQEIDLISKSVYFKDTIYVFNANSVQKFPIQNVSLKKISPIIYIENSFDLLEKFTTKIDLEKVEVFSKKEGIYFMDGGEGSVYKYDPKDNSVEKIHQSNKQWMQNFSSNFIYNDSLFRYGGYGFWSTRNMMVYFNSSKHDWEPIAPLHTLKVPEGSFDSKTAISGSNIRVLGGFKLNPNDLVSKMPMNQIWNYDVNQHQWTNLGSTKQVHLINLKGFNYQKYLVTADDKYFYRIDAFKNKIETFKKNPFTYKIVRVNGLKPLYHKGLFYCFYYNNEGGISLKEIKENELFSDLYRTDSLLDSPSYAYYMYGVLGMFLFIGGYRFLKKNTNNKKISKIGLNPQGITYERVFYAFEPVEIKLLKQFAKRGEISSQEIIQIIENPKYKYSYNNRQKLKIISDINSKLKMIIKQESEVIDFKKSTEDKRIYLYFMDKDLFS